MLKLKRRKVLLKVIPRLLIVCEGKVTERIYLEGIRRFRRIPKELVTLDCAAGVPKTLVDRAVSLKEQNIQQSNGNSDLVYDQIWCVFDRDEHPFIPEAKQKAKAHKLKIAFSNPCFELFLLLHCADCNRDLHRDAVRALLKEFIPTYDKSFDYDALHDKYSEAKKRTTAINKNSRTIAQIESAPFCSVPSLIDQLRRGM